jgi:hypothetical protein
MQTGAKSSRSGPVASGSRIAGGGTKKRGRASSAKPQKPENAGSPKAPATPKKPYRKRTQAEIIATIRKKVEIKLKKDAKATLGDYIRLLQLQKDLEDADLREIKVTWVEPTKTKSEPEE